MINKDLKDYIEKNVIPEYSKNDVGHSFKHVFSVIDNSLELANKLNLDMNMSYTIAAFHDIGHHIDANNHELVSADIMKKDEFINKFFDEVELTTIYEAICDHRASSESEPRSIYGKVVSSADRSMDLEETLERSYQYGLHHFPTYSKEQHIDRIYNYLNSKFGASGNAVIYFETEKNLKMKKEIQRLLDNKNQFNEKLEDIMKKVN